MVEISLIVGLDFQYTNFGSCNNSSKGDLLYENINSCLFSHHNNHFKHQYCEAGLACHRNLQGSSSVFFHFFGRRSVLLDVFFFIKIYFSLDSCKGDLGSKKVFRSCCHIPHSFRNTLLYSRRKKKLTDRYLTTGHACALSWPKGQSKCPMD